MNDCDTHMLDETEQDDLNFEPVSSTSNSESNFLSLPSVALISDRKHTSDRSAAMIASAVPKDLGIITDVNPKDFID